MDLTVEIVAREAVKPRSPTPPCLRNYKLSHMDQLCPSQYVPFLLFYSNSTVPAAAATDDHDRIKRALAETLTHMYPLAGRVNHDGMSINCNDHGAEYVVTRINESMSTVLENPKIHFLQQLLPLKLSPAWRSSINNSTGNQPLVALQINHFSCSGVAIGVCIRHVIADASVASAFLQMWAAIACGNRKYADHDHDPDKVGGNLIFTGCTAIFPPGDDLEVFDSIWKEERNRESHTSKLLVFDGPKVAALKEKIGSTTRVQTVMAFLWAAMIATALDRNQELEMHSLSIPVNLRNKMEPPLPAYTMGNILHATTAMWKAAARRGDCHETKIEIDELVQEVKRSIDMVTEDFVREAHRDLDEFIRNMVAGLKFKATSSKVEGCGMSSWCRFPFYETDFGWGKPVWVATLATLKNTAILMDTRDSAGIQVWLSLPNQDMEKLEKDPNFLANVSAMHSL